MMKRDHSDIDIQRAHYREWMRTAPVSRSPRERVELICEMLERAPYESHPLGCDPSVREEFRIQWKSFDCVTFLETVTAFCGTRTFDSFRRALRLLRYEDGRVTYGTRRHYMSRWIAGNIEEGRLKPMEGLGPWQRTWRRTLTVLPELGDITVDINGIPKQKWNHAREQVCSGDLVFFITCRSDLDYFHTGLLLKRNTHHLLAHASRTAGEVVLEPIANFLKRNRMSGLSMARPVFDCDPAGRGAR